MSNYVGLRDSREPPFAACVAFINSLPPQLEHLAIICWPSYTFNLDRYNGIAQIKKFAHLQAFEFYENSDGPHIFPQSCYECFHIHEFLKLHRETLTSLSIQMDILVTNQSTVAKFNTWFRDHVTNITFSSLRNVQFAMLNMREYGDASIAAVVCRLGSQLEELSIGQQLYIPHIKDLLPHFNGHSLRSLTIHVLKLEAYILEILCKAMPALEKLSIFATPARAQAGPQDRPLHDVIAFCKMCQSMVFAPWALREFCLIFGPCQETPSSSCIETAPTASVAHCLPGVKFVFEDCKNSYTAFSSRKILSVAPWDAKIST